jgi:hypothetical protein
MIADSSTGLAEKLLDWRAIFILAYFGLLFVASYLGFVPPDGAEYLRMAKSIVVGHGCSLSGNYSAIWPCGYPMSIALLGFGRDFISLIFVSKITNFLLVVTGMLMLSSVIRDYRIILLATLNPVIWGIAPWTISENLFCFAVFGITATTQKLHDIMISGTLQYVKIAFWSAAVCLFIVIGYFARYFFAPFAVALYAATLFAYGRRTALAALPAYIVAAGLFLVLIHYNSEETGFGTGMTRLPAQESMRFLLIYFSLQCVRVVSRFVPVFIILWPEYIFSFKRTLGTDKKTDAASPPLLSGFLIFSSIGYMALQFLIRCFFSYDLFTFRLIGPGLVLLISGLALAVMRGRSAQRESAWFGPSLKTLTLAVYCFVVSLYSLELGGILSDWRLGRATSARALILNSKAPATNAKVVFSFVRTPL